MLYDSISAAAAGAAAEIYERRPAVLSVNTSFRVSQPMLPQLITGIYDAEPRLVPSVKSISSVFLNAIAGSNVRMEISYTSVLLGTVEKVDGPGSLTGFLSRATRRHIRNAVFVFDAAACCSEEIMDLVRHANMLSEVLINYAVLNDHCVYTHRGRFKAISLNFSYTCAMREAITRNTELERQIRKIAADISGRGSEDWRKAFLAVMYAAENWRYGKPDLQNGSTLQYTAYGAVVGRKAVCKGISLAFKAICDELGIPCRYVFGTMNGSPPGSPGHAWNLIYISGGWFFVDVTFAVCSGNPFAFWGVTSLTDRTISPFCINANVPTLCTVPEDWIRKRLPLFTSGT